MADDIGKVKLNDVRISFPVLWEARAPSNQPNAKKKFSAAFIFPKGSPAEKAVLSAMTAVAKAKWGEKAKDVFTSLKAGDKLALHDGDSKATNAGYSGNMFLNASGELRPLVVDRNRSPLTSSDGKPYPGCYVNAYIQVWAQDNQFGKRINASLMGVQFLRDGERLAGGSVVTADDFEAIPEAAEGAASADAMFD